MPTGRKLRPYWRRILGELHERYSGVCAYVCIYIDIPIGGHTVDHCLAKSRAIEEAYRWRNYRLASARMNGRKCDYTDVLDPFMLAADTFRLELVSGRIYPSPGLDPAMLKRAQDTIDRLGLDDDDCRRARRDYFDDYMKQHISLAYVERRAPFVFCEMIRQGLI